MKKVYFISGLGADRRIFSYLDLSFCEPVFIEWLTPVKDESLREYALRLRQQIPEESPVITGISFGGMLTTEIAKADPKVKAIIIASNKTSSELPAYYRIGKYLPVYRWSSPALSKKFTLWNRWIIGGTTDEEIQLLHRIISESDIRFIRWAIGAILHWDNKTVPPNLIHIHGTADKLLPCRRVKPDYRIKGGTHVMTLDKHREISLLLKELIQ